MSASDSQQTNPKQKHSPNSPVTLFCQANCSYSQVCTAVLLMWSVYVPRWIKYCLLFLTSKNTVECYPNCCQFSYCYDKIVFRGLFFEKDTVFNTYLYALSVCCSFMMCGCCVCISASLITTTILSRLAVTWCGTMKWSHTLFMFNWYDLGYFWVFYTDILICLHVCFYKLHSLTIGDTSV